MNKTYTLEVHRSPKPERGIKHTIELVDDSLRILVHVQGGRPLTKQMPNNGLHWSVAICTLDRGFTLMEGDVDALYDEASRLGRPLFRREAMAILLGRRLSS